MSRADVKNRCVVRVLLVGTLCASVCGPAGSQKRITIDRNKAWNHLMLQFTSAHEHIAVLHKFLIEHEREVRVSVYDVETFRAIDQAEEDLKSAQDDLRKIRSELEYKDDGQNQPH